MSEAPERGDMRATALLLGGGEGTRLGGVIKAFLEVGGKSLLERCVDQAAGLVDQVIVGLPAAEVDNGQALLGGRAQVVAGGETRQATFEQVLGQAVHPTVVIHDVARPLASDHLFRAVLDGARANGATAPVIPISERDSLALAENGTLGEPVDRSRLVAIQTPYGFSRVLLHAALDHSRQNNLVASSVTVLVAEFGERVHVIAGEPGNIKITYPEDWEWVSERLSEADA